MAMQCEINVFQSCVYLLKLISDLNVEGTGLVSLVLK